MIEHYPNIFDSLKGKFQKQDIIDFVEAAQKDIAYKQLLELLLEKVKRVFPTSNSASGIQFTPTSIPQSINDPYGDYGSSMDAVPVSEEKSPSDLLWEAFN